MRRLVFWGLAVSVVLAGAISYYASPRPDGLERAGKIVSDIAGPASGDGLPAPMPDYAVPGIRNARLARGLAGAIGVACTFAICFAVGKLVSRRSGSVDGEGE